MKSGKGFLSKLTTSFLLLQLLQNPVFAQENIGYNYNNYIGVNGIVSNPASIAASRYKVHVNLLTVNAYAGSNAYEFSSKKLFKLQLNNWQEGTDFRKVTTDELKHAWTNVDILGPSFMVNLKKKGALGVTTRFRTIVNAYNFSSGSFNTIGNVDPSIFGKDFSERNIRMNASSFADLGIAYAKILKNKDKNFLKGGFTIKYIQGFANAHLRIDSLDMNFTDADNIQKMHGSGSMVYSENIDRLTQGGAAFNPMNEISFATGTFGLDLGLVYERRSGKFNPKYGTLKSLFRELPYDYRLSVAVTDFTVKPVQFQAGQQSASYNITADAVGRDTFNVRSDESSDEYLQRLQYRNLVTKQTASGAFDMPLPTTVRVNFDYHISRYFFVNADVMYSLRGAKSKKAGPNYISTISVTPRFEKQWYSVYTPFSMNVQQQMNWGVGFRLGPLFAGSGSVLSNAIKSDFRNLDAHVGLSIPVYQGVRTRKEKKRPEEETDQPKEEPKKETKKEAPAKVKDKDKDGVADDKDACPDVAGPVETDGCPDTDKDGIADNKDLCPKQPGFPKYNGCPVPDADNDGVTDEVDKCPKVAGPVENNGCPEIQQEVKKKVESAAKNLFFISGKATIQTRSYPALNQLANVMRKDSTLSLDIEGHTDNVGKDEFNMRLSQMRANAAKDYLVSIGIDAARITAQGFGETEPVATNTTKEGRAKNRRIVLKIRNY
jgi:outer membrane protein OmpA-like peptidoglycan-associated protein